LLGMAGKLGSAATRGERCLRCSAGRRKAQHSRNGPKSRAHRV
jgi:hypothetical protein